MSDDFHQSHQIYRWVRGSAVVAGISRPCIVAVCGASDLKSCNEDRSKECKDDSGNYIAKADSISRPHQASVIHNSPSSTAISHFFRPAKSSPHFSCYLPLTLPRNPSAPTSSARNPKKTSSRLLHHQSQLHPPYPHSPHLPAITPHRPHQASASLPSSTPTPPATMQPTSVLDTGRAMRPEQNSSSVSVSARRSALWMAKWSRRISGLERLVRGRMSVRPSSCLQALAWP